MLHDIKRTLKENGDKEYMNHINLLKMIKLDIENEKIKFQERVQGAETSLFIENIFTVAKLESKSTMEFNDPESLVHNVIEKKVLIEKLREKMTQRLDIINSMLANQSLINNIKPTNRALSTVVKSALSGITPKAKNSNKRTSAFKMFDNTSIQQSDVNFKHFHFVYNFYNKSTDVSARGKSPKPLKKPTPIKARKIFGGSKRRPSKQLKQSSQEKWFPSIKNKKKGIVQTIAQEHLLPKVEMTPQPSQKAKVMRNQSIEGVKSSNLLSDESDIERDDDESNIRLYYVGVPHMSGEQSVNVSKHMKSTDVTNSLHQRDSIEPHEFDPGHLIPIKQESSKLASKKLKTQDLANFNIKQMRISNNKKFLNANKYYQQ